MRFELVLVADIHGVSLAEMGYGELFGLSIEGNTGTGTLSLPIDSLLVLRLCLTSLVDLHGEANSQKDAPLRLLMHRYLRKFELHALIPGVHLLLFAPNRTDIQLRS
jgi:hypothetical protein